MTAVIIKVILVKHYFVSPFLFNNKKTMFIYNKMINYLFYFSDNFSFKQHEEQDVNSPKRTHF